MVRECLEETGYHFEIDRLAFVCEHFFKEKQTKENFHEICFYYLMKLPENFRPKCESQTDQAVKERLEWIDIKETEKKTSYPELLAMDFKK